jgi:hypothetical protein
MTRLLLLGLLATTPAALAAEQRLATDKPVGKLELVTTFNGPMTSRCQLIFLALEGLASVPAVREEQPDE